MKLSWEIGDFYITLMSLRVRLGAFFEFTIMRICDNVHLTQRALFLLSFDTYCFCLHLFWIRLIELHFGDTLIIGEFTLWGDDFNSAKNKEYTIQLANKLGCDTSSYRKAQKFIDEQIFKKL